MSKAEARGSVLANILQSVGAGIFTAIAGFACSVIVARLLGVTGTASIAIALWIVFAATTLFDLGLAATQARFVPEAKDRGDARSAAIIEALLYRRFLIMVVVGAVGLLAAYLLYWRDALPEYTAGIASPLFFYTLIVVCFAVHMLYAFAYHRLRSHHRFEQIARLSFAGMLLQIASVAGLALLFGPSGALVGYILGSVPVAVALFRAKVRSPEAPPALTARITRYARGLWLASLFSPLLWSRVDLFLVGLYLDVRALGLFAAAAVTAALLLQICQMICNALLPNLVVATRDATADHLREVSGRTIGIVLLALFPICFGTAALAPAIINVVYGAEFRGAGEAATLLAIAACASAVTVVCGNVLNLIERNSSLVASGVVGAVLTLGLTIYALPRYGIVGAAAARIAAQSTVALITLLQIHRQLPGSVSWGAIGAKLAASIICFAAARAALDPEALTSIPLAILAGGAGFAITLPPLLVMSKAGRGELHVLWMLANRRLRNKAA